MVVRTKEPANCHHRSHLIPFVDERMRFTQLRRHRKLFEVQDRFELFNPGKRDPTLTGDFARNRSCSFVERLPLGVSMVGQPPCLGGCHLAPTEGGRLCWFCARTQNVIWYVVRELRHPCGHQSPSTSRFEENLRSFVPRGRRRTGADPVFARPCIRSDNGALHRVQTGSLQSCQ